MKKQIRLLSILLLLPIFTVAVNGQVKEKMKDNDYLGILAGGTLSNISNFNADSRMGFIGGLYWEWKFSEKFSTMPSLLYAERGAKGLKLSYITIPIVIKYNVTNKISIATGLGWDELVAVNSDDYKYKDIRHDDWRVPVTLGYNFTDHLAMGINYSFGLSSIMPDAAEKLRNNWGSIALAYIFGQKGK